MVTNVTLSTAIRAAKTQFKPLERNGVNPSTQCKFTTLDDLLGSISDALTDNDLLLTQPIVHENGITLLKTIIELNDCEDVLMASIPIIIPNDPRKLGTILTCYRRYLLASLLGISIEDDDKAESSERMPEHYTEREAAIITRVTAARLKANMPAHQVAEFSRAVGGNDKRVRDYTPAQVDELCKMILNGT